MASKRNTAITYTVLFLTLLASCVFLALQVRFYINDKTNPVAGYSDRLIDTDTVIQNIKRDEDKLRTTTLLQFNNTQAFAPIATPIPRPTPTPIPLPSPTPVQVARGWTVIVILNEQWASIKDFTGRKMSVRSGQEIDNSVQGEDLGFTILEINNLQKWVKVQDKKGNTDIIKESPRSAAPAPVQGQAQPGQPPRGRLKSPSNQ